MRIKADKGVVLGCEVPKTVCGNELVIIECRQRLCDDLNDRLVRIRALISGVEAPACTTMKVESGSTSLMCRRVHFCDVDCQSIHHAFKNPVRSRHMMQLYNRARCSIQSEHQTAPRRQFEGERAGIQGIALVRNRGPCPWQLGAETLLAAPQ